VKRFFVFLFCAGALVAADDPIGRMLNDKLNPTQRNNACFALRGNKSPETIAAMRAALSSDAIRACAGRNLLEAGAVDELKSALTDTKPEVRALAARELGALKRPEFMPLLAKAARDPNALAASNAVAGLGQYEDPAVLPYLLDLCKDGGFVGVAALSRATRFSDPAVLNMARKQLTGTDVAGRLVALRIISERGNAEDLPSLRQIVAKKEVLANRGRGFGLMPSVDLSQAAQQAIEGIRKRAEEKAASPSKEDSAHR